MKEKERMLDKKSMAFKLEKMTKKSIAENQISRSRLVKKKSLQEKGITLIALVVTIIILLILAGVTLNMALSQDGLFSKTQEAAEKYKQAQSDEEEMVRQIATQMYSEYVGATVEGYSIEEKTVTIDGTTSGLSSNKDDKGNVIDENISEANGNQEFKTDTGMKWRVWDFDGNILRIIGDPTSQDLYLKGATGYNNGVDTINQICGKLYSNKEKGAIATNLKRTDIQNVSTYDYTKYKHIPSEDIEKPEGDASSTLQFGESKPYENAKYPSMWDKNDKDWTYEWNDGGTTTGWDKECKKWENIKSEKETNGISLLGGNGKQTFKQSYYWHSYQQSEFKNDEYYNLIFKKASGEYVGEYWLMGRYANLREDCCRFGLQSIGTDNTNKFVAR